MDLDYVRIYKKATGGTTPPPPQAAAPTWSEVYAKVFGPGTVGHCGNSGCHATTRAGFKCSTKADCYQSFVALKLVDGTRSTLATEGETPLGWLGGSMPPDGSGDQAEATDLLRRWIAAGAKND